MTSQRFLRQGGVTLLEALLVLAIAATIITVVMRQYQIFRADYEVRQVAANVDTLFGALSTFYKVNCGRTVDYYGNVSATGLLYPLQTSPYKVNINTGTNNLRASGYLERWPLQFSTYVNPTAAGTENGYIVQFNLVENAGRPASTNTGTTTIGRNYRWQAQVAMSLRNPADANRLRGLLAADCTSRLSGSTVAPCSSGLTGSFLVWARSPILAKDPTTSSPLWVSLPLLLQFKELYTNDSYYELTNPNYAGTQYYTCGG